MTGKLLNEFAGMTKLECCAACTPGHCVISGVGICAHPNKGGNSQLPDGAAALARFKRAKAALVLARHLENLERAI